MTDGGQPAGIIYGTPLETIRALLQSKKTVETATIGASNVEIWEKPGDFRRRYPEGTEGVVIGHIQEDGPAARAGLKDGDVVIAVDGRATGLCEQFLRLIRAKKPGDEVKLTVLTRDKDAKREVVVTLGKLE
jgi:S1-C subfamily serine protease